MSLQTILKKKGESVMKEFWNKLIKVLKESWNKLTKVLKENKYWVKFRAWKYSTYALWAAAAVAVTAVAVVIVLCAVGPKGNDTPTLPTGGSSMDNTNPTDGTTIPEDETTEPEDETTEPEDETTAPEDETTAPEENATKPNGGSTGNGDNTGNGGNTTTPEDDIVVPGPAKAPVVEHDNTNSGAPLAPEATAAQVNNLVAVKTSTAGGAITAHPGGRITYTISITNNNSSAVSVTVTDSLPAGTSLVRGCGTVSGNNLTWKVNSIAAGKTHNIIYTVKPEYTVAQVHESGSDIIIKNTGAKVMDKAIAAPAKDIWVLETFNDTDIRRIEMAIDSLVTANLNVSNPSTGALNQINQASMMYTVGFSLGLYMPTDLDDILTRIYEKGGENNEITNGTNLLERVVPTLYGGTAVPASKDSQFRGARATSVSAKDLISGDLVIVNKSGATKLYIYDGTYLVELGEKAVTTNINPTTVLSDLPKSDKYVVMRPSINLNTIFSLENDEYFNDYDKGTYTKAEYAIIKNAESFLLRGDRLQYSDTSQIQAKARYYHPEDYTVDQYGYTNCANFTHNVHWTTSGKLIKAPTTSSSNATLTTTKTILDSAKLGWDAATGKGSNASTVLYYELDPTKDASGVWHSNLNESERKALQQKITALLRPGDLVCYQYATGSSGHVLLYVGDGLLIHSGGSNYSDTGKTDTHEASVRYASAASLFDETNTGSRYLFIKRRFAIIRPSELNGGAISKATITRVNNMQGIIAEKVSSTALGKTVNSGDEITYTFHVFNTNKAAKTVAIKDVLSPYVSFVSATNSGSVSGSNISWNIDVPAETRISVSYTVKVKDGVATYSAIDGSKATINGLAYKCIDSFVANTLTTTQQQTLINAAKEVKASGVSGKTGIEILNAIYNKAFGITNIFGEGVTSYEELLNGDKGIFNDENKIADSRDAKAVDMVAPGMYGGRSVKDNSNYTRYTDAADQPLRNRYFWEKDLVVGDICLMQYNNDKDQLYIYIGNDTFLSVGEGFEVFTEQSVSERFQLMPSKKWNYYAILRPSIVWNNI